MELSDVLMSEPLVSLITVNYNGKAFLEPLLDSILGQEFPPEQLEIILVDNGSSDGSLELLQSRYPRVRVIANRENYGFAKANNQGAEIARGRYLALINNDMRLEPDWLSRMVAYLAAAPEGMICASSKIVNWDGTLIDFMGGTLAFNGMGFQTNFRAPVDAPAAQDYPQELLFACGGAMLIDREVYREVGGFDEDYFAYFEDVDLGWRLWVMGYRVGFCPEAIAYHRFNGTSGKFGWHKKLVLFERNSLYTVIKNYDDASLARILPAALLLSVKRMAVRSGVPREDYRFAATSAPKSQDSPASREFRLKKALGILRREGIKMLAKKSLVKLAEAIQRRWKDLPTQPIPEGYRPIRHDGYATVVGLEDLMDHLPRLMEKRQEVQRQRRRSDQEIFRLFKTPFEVSESNADYPAVFASVAESLGVVSLVQAADRQTSLTEVRE